MEGERKFDPQNPLSGLTARQLQGAIVAVVVIVVGGWAALTCAYTIAVDEVGVVLRFGRYTGTPAPPGLHFKLPFGIDRVVPVAVQRVHKAEFGTLASGGRRGGRDSGRADPALMLTGDLNVVRVDWVVQYKIKNAADYIFNLESPEESLRDLAESTMRLVLGDASATEALTARRREISRDAKERLQEKLDEYRSGIEVRSIELQNLVPPTQAVKDSFNGVNTARQEKETRINVARRAFQKAIPAAQGKARQAIAEAEGYKLKRVNEAEGDVANFLALLAEYETSKEVTRQRLYLEAVEEVLPKLTQIYVVDEAQHGLLQVLDLKASASASQRVAPPGRGASSSSRPESPAQKRPRARSTGSQR